MSKYLVIVESPAKAETIKKFLGKNYEVMASNGHVRDLPKSRLGVDVENDYEPKYITIRGKGELLAKLRKAAKKADKVYLATDPDREGEAISWHLLEALRLDNDKTSRITFNEITKNAVKQSIKEARDIDMNLVDAQQVRRMLDRMVGYKISPLLWAKVKNGLSAGRVQSVALRLICDREKEIDSFIPKEYWSLDALFGAPGDKKPFKAHFYGNADGRIELDNEKQVDDIIGKLTDADFEVSDIKVSERIKKSPKPFTTSTMQQESAKTLNFSTQKTMRIAQQLYEGVHIKGYGTIGLITYLRTDSTRISEEADGLCREFISQNYGSEYVISGGGEEKSKRKIQDAHEAIRPTYVDLTPVKIKEQLSREQFRLYQLIWKRFVASRMEYAKYETTSIKIDGGGYRFTAVASKVKFAGYLSVYQSEEDRQESDVISSKIEKGMKLKAGDFDKQQHFTQPPAHFTEASLVKTLEELGIGRPSTYAPTITTIISRRYVAKEKKNLYVTELGEIVNSIMVSEFASIVDVNFTANLEGLLDCVEEGTVAWKTVVRNFYPDLEIAVEKAEKELQEIKIEDEVTEEICDNCGRNMVIKYGPHGKFLACPGFPDCRNTKPYYEKIGVSCPECGGDIVIKKTQKGRRYYGCLNHPECDFMSWQKPSGKLCPECGKMMVEKGSKLVCMDNTCGYMEKKPN